MIERLYSVSQHKEKIYFIIFIGCAVAITFLITYFYLSDNFRFLCMIGRIENYKCVNEIPKHSYQCAIKSNDTSFIQELESKCETIFDGVWVKIPETNIKINSWGFRDYEYPIEKSNNTFRIIVLGDSITFGWGVELNESYPKIIENLLNSNPTLKSDIKYEVLNFGVPGYSISEKVRFFEKLGIKFNPDLVIIQYGSDDIINNTELKMLSEKILSNYMTENSINNIDSITQALLNKKTKEMYVEELSKKSFDEVWKNIEYPLEELGNITVRTNKSVLIWIIHSNDAIPHFSIKEQLKNLKEVSIKYKWDILIGIMDKNYNKYNWWDLIIHPEDGHPNAFTHKLIAKEIYEKLIKDKLIPN